MAQLLKLAYNICQSFIRRQFFENRCYPRNFQHTRNSELKSEEYKIHLGMTKIPAMVKKLEIWSIPVPKDVLNQRVTPIPLIQ